jgi:hypothetical protein
VGRLDNPSTIQGRTPWAGNADDLDALPKGLEEGLEHLPHQFVMIPRRVSTEQPSCPQQRPVSVERISEPVRPKTRGALDKFLSEIHPNTVHVETMLNSRSARIDSRPETGPDRQPMFRLFRIIIRGAE